MKINNNTNKEFQGTPAHFDDLDDQSLISLAKSGNKAAYRSLTQRYKQKIWRLAISILKDEQEAEDATQEVFLSLWQSLSKWEENGKAKFSTWLYRVSFNKCIDIKRSKKEITSDDNTPEKAMNADAHDNVLRGQVAEKIAGLMKALPEAQRIAILLYYYEELSVNEISSHMDTSEQGVRSLLKRGKKTLRDKIQFEPALKSWDFKPDMNQLHDV